MDEGCSFKNKYLRGYVLSIEQECPYGIEKTGRIVVSHSRTNGKRTFRDIWQRDSEGKLQFVFRNPWDKPFTNHDHIKDLEAQISELKEYGRKLQAQLKNAPDQPLIPILPWKHLTSRSRNLFFLDPKMNPCGTNSRL